MRMLRVPNDEVNRHGGGPIRPFRGVGEDGEGVVQKRVGGDEGAGLLVDGGSGVGDRRRLKYSGEQRRTEEKRGGERRTEEKRGFDKWSGMGEERWWKWLIKTVINSKLELAVYNLPKTYRQNCECPECLSEWQLYQN